MTYTASGGLMEQHGSFTSWGQDESWCKSYGNDVPWNVQVLEFFGSEWCPDYEVAVDWGKYDYSLALDYTTDVNGNTVTSLAITFDNEPFTSYDVSSGRWSGGGESRSVTGERIDWVELVALDEAGNAIELPLMSDGTVWYSTEQSDPDHVRRVVDINTLAPDWSAVGIRVFFTIGQYVAAAPQHHWKDWAPPADLGLAGSGESSGANRQVFTWWLASDTLEGRYSLADYRSALNPTAGIDAAAESPIDLAVTPAEPAESQATSISLVSTSSGPARLGTPFVVDLVISGFDSRPLYGIEFDLVFNKAYFRLVSIQCGADFGGPAGCHVRPLDLAGVNTAGKITDAAVVRLGVPAGLSQGRVVRLIFMPVKLTSGAITLAMQNLTLADLESDLFTPDHVNNLSVAIANMQVYLPVTHR